MAAKITKSESASSERNDKLHSKCGKHGLQKGLAAKNNNIILIINIIQAIMKQLHWNDKINSLLFINIFNLYKPHFLDICVYNFIKKHFL